MENSSRYMNVRPGRANDSNYVPNVMRINFRNLKPLQECVMGDPVQCKNCKAVLTSISKLTRRDGNRQLWICEYCNFENKVAIDQDEVPKGDDFTFVVESPEQDQHTKEFNTVVMTNVIFCIDISGSMCQSYEVTEPNLRLLTDDIRQQKYNTVNSLVPIDGGHVNQTSTVRYISRLEAVQAAIVHSLKTLSRNEPEKRVSLVTFNNEVTIIGDGTNMEKKVLRDRDLNDERKIIKAAEQTPVLKPIHQTHDQLKKQVLALEEGGATALGPALLYAIKYASAKRGSKVILCTDGLANEGFGSLEKPVAQSSIDFYTNLSDMAITNGVSVSIITIEGTHCGLGVLGQLADKTRGEVKIVDVKRLSEAFPSILDDKVIATNVNIKVILPQQLYIRDHNDIASRESKIKRNIGNVTEQTEETFEYLVKDNERVETTKLPIQVQITYNTLDNGKFLRVLYKEVPVTNDQSLVEQHANRGIIGQYVISNQAELAQQGSKSNVLDSMAQNLKHFKLGHDDNFDDRAFEDDQQVLQSVSRKNAPGRAGMLADDFVNADDVTTSKIISFKNKKHDGKKNDDN